jgi:hypothetical protein
MIHKKDIVRVAHLQDQSVKKAGCFLSKVCGFAAAA